MAELKGKRKGNKKKYNSSKRDTEFSEEFKDDLNVNNDMKTNSITKKNTR